MRALVKLLIKEDRIRSIPSIYISILLAYLELLNWEEAQSIMRCIEELELNPIEEEVLFYLDTLIELRDEAEVKALLEDLSH